MRRLLLGGLATLMMAGCTADFADNGTAPVILRLVRIQGDSGADKEKTWEDVLRSDVLTGGGVFDDLALLKFELMAKNPGFKDPNTKTMSDVLLDSYHVKYTRSDGHNVEGVDVPYSFSGPMSATVSLNSTGQLEVVVTAVRHSAKFEPPLRYYQRLGSEMLVSTSAEFTVYGKTISGHAVQASGRLEIVFGDFADPTTAPTT